MTEPAKLCVSNQKGGVGKTAVAINLAGALHDRGHRVLLVDLDPQGNATEGLGHPDAYDASPPSLFDVLTEPDQREALPDIIRSHHELDLIPSNIDMTAAEPELTLSRRGGEQLSLALQHVETDYDYVIVDCPPSLGNLADNALYATQNIVIPALAESTSKRAFELLFDHIQALERDYGINIREQAVVANRVDVRKNEAGEMMDWLEAAFDDVPVWEVRERAAIQKAFSAGESLVSFDPECDMAGVFREIARDLDARFGRSGGGRGE